MKSFKEFLVEATPDTNYVSKTLFNKNVKNITKGKLTHVLSTHHAGKEYHVHIAHDVHGDPEQMQIHHEGKPVGYMDSKIDEKHKTFKEGNTALHPEHQGTGLMGHVYLKLVQHGYTIHSHDSHSAGMKKTWERLGKHPDVNVSSDKNGLVARKK